MTHTYSFAGGLRCNEGPKWSPLVWEKCTGTQPGQHFNEVYEQRKEKLSVDNRNKRKPENKVKRWKRKMKSVSESKTKKASLEPLLTLIRETKHVMLHQTFPQRS